MSSDPLAPVWTRLENVQPIFFHADLGRALKGQQDRLIGLGWLKEVTPSRFGQCLECGGGNLIQAVWLPNTRTGESEPRLPCPTCGPVPISADSLRRWVIDVPALLGCVSAAGVRQTRAELVENHLWHLGSATWLGHSRQVYFARAAHARVRESVAGALKSHLRAVLFHPTEHALCVWGGLTSNPGAAFESVVSLTPEGLTFDSKIVEGRLRDAGFDEPTVNPTRKRVTRVANIARLTEAVIEHLRRARDHAFATRELSKNKEPQLLKRLTQKELGELVGLEPYEVSRCFADEAARELHLYWEAALDLDAVMKFQGPISADPNA